MRPVFGLSETDLYSKSWTNPGIQHVSDVQCVANCSMRNAFIGREKCTAEMIFIGKNFSSFDSNFGYFSILWLFLTSLILAILATFFRMVATKSGFVTFIE